MVERGSLKSMLNFCDGDYSFLMINNIHRPF